MKWVKLSKKTFENSITTDKVYEKVGKRRNILPWSRIKIDALFIYKHSNITQYFHLKFGWDT